MFGNNQGKFGKLAVFFLRLLQQGFALGKGVGVLLLQFVQLRLGGLAVTLGAFVLRVLGADLFF